MRVIKRYSNRRFYDTATSSTMTLSELGSLIHAGSEIKVVDNKSGRDITVEVLGRILLASVSGRKDVRSSKEVLRQTIILTGDKSMSILKNTVLASIGIIDVTMAKAEEIVDQLIKKGEVNDSDRKKAVMELVERAEKTTAKLTERVGKEAGRVQHEVQAAIDKLNLVKRNDLQDLEKKVDDLNNSIAALQKKLEEQ